jgi:hypothetical protein
MKLQLLACISLAAIAFSTSAQTTAELTLKPWKEGQFGETLDKAFYEEQGHVKGEDDRGAQVFWWDSRGRFRFNKTDPDAFSLAYRYLTINFDTNSRTVPDTLDDMSLAGGIHLGTVGDWKVSTVLGLGYASDNLFADVNGLYGIGHLLFEKQFNESDSLVLGVMYDGNSGLFPDVPLPEFAFTHRSEHFDYTLGFPQSALRYDFTRDLQVRLGYTVPYTGDVTLEYQLGNGVSVFGNYTNFFNGFYLDGEGREDRLFYEMRRAEIGLRYQNPNIYKGIALDAAIVLGYAFDQELTRRFDARDRDPFSELSDEPYIGIVLIGAF